MIIGLGQNTTTSLPSTGSSGSFTVNWPTNPTALAAAGATPSPYCSGVAIAAAPGGTGTNLNSQQSCVAAGGTWQIGYSMTGSQFMKLSTADQMAILNTFVDETGNYNQDAGWVAYLLGSVQIATLDPQVQAALNRGWSVYPQPATQAQINAACQGLPPTYPGCGNASTTTKQTACAFYQTADPTTGACGLNFSFVGIAAAALLLFVFMGRS